MPPAPDRSANGVPGHAPAGHDPGIESVLHDAATLWDAIWHTTGEYVVIVDRTGIIHACNRVDDGFTLDQVVGHSIVRFTLPESTAMILETLRRAFETGESRSLETVVQRLDGQLSHFSLRVAPIRRHDRTVAVLACCASLGPLKDTEQALRHERNMLTRLLEIQEQERQLVSYEIHDGLAQYLAGALMHFQAYAHAQGDREPPQDFAAGMQLLHDAVTESRRLIGGLRPPALDELGIVAAVDTLVAEARSDVPEVAFAHAMPDDRLPSRLETVIFRIVQEALTNARRHAAAHRIDVFLERTAGLVRVRVRDDGRGFDPAAVPEGRFGLEGIRHRCRLVGGEALIESAPGVGTSIEASFPLPDDA